MSLPRIHLGRPQQLAALLLLVFLAECLFVVSRQQLSPADFRFARCGREMWERPGHLAGYFTTCGNLSGDGTFAYRAAGLPLTLQRLVLLASDSLRAPANRLYSGSSINGSTWEAHLQLSSLKYLLNLPFILFAAWAGAGLWWVSRRLFGNLGGAFSLALYILSPTVIAAAVTPNNDILAMWGLFGLVYTAIGVAHAMHGPRRRWRPRILLLLLALGLTAAAHLLAAIFGFVASACFLFYLAERRRSYVLQILIVAALGALLILFACFAFRPTFFSYIFTGGSARFWFSTFGAHQLFGTFRNAPITLAFLVAVILYLGTRRSRYFGNTAPLLTGLPLLFLLPTQSFMTPWLWALPFLLTFIGGVFADVFETRHRRLFLTLAAAILLTEATATLSTLPLLAHP